MSTGPRIRAGTRSDVARLLPRYDQTVTWLADRGRAAQWGPEPWSAQPRLIALLDDTAKVVTRPSARRRLPAGMQGVGA